MALAIALGLVGTILAVFSFVLSVYNIIIIKSQKPAERVFVPEYEAHTQGRSIFRPNQEDNLGQPDVYDPEEEADIDFFDKTGI